MKNAAGRPFWFGLAVGLLVLVPVMVVATVRNEWYRLPPKPIGDGFCYESIACSLWSGGGFRENYSDPQWQQLYAGDPQYAQVLTDTAGRNLPATGRPPLLPVVIAGVYSVLGRGPTAFAAIRMLAALCIAVSNALAVALTAQLLANRSRQLAPVVVGTGITLLVAATQRTLRDYATDLLTEPLALLLTQFLVTAVALQSDLVKQNAQVTADPLKEGGFAKLRWSICYGILIGLMILTRSLFVVWVPGLLGLIWLSLGSDRGSRLRLVLGTAAVAGAVCLPWWIHNCLTLGRFMPLGTQGPIAMLGGYCDQALQDGGNWHHEPEQQLRELLSTQEEFQRAADDTQRELIVVSRAQQVLNQWIANNLHQLPSLAIHRAITHWNPYTGRSGVWKLMILSGAIWTLMERRRLTWWLIGLPALSTVSVMALYATGGRFLVPLYGLLFTLAGLGVSGWWLKRSD